MIPWYVDLIILAQLRALCTICHDDILFQTGFKLEENITMQGISSESLKITCKEVICWGNSFKSLSRLVMPDLQTGKLQQDGLIFKVRAILTQIFTTRAIHFFCIQLHMI